MLMSDGSSDTVNVTFRGFTADLLGHSPLASTVLLLIELLYGRMVSFFELVATNCIIASYVGEYCTIVQTFQYLLLFKLFLSFVKVMYCFPLL